MKVDLLLFLYWVMIPFINFLVWFYLSKTHFFSPLSSCPGQLEAHAAVPQDSSMKSMLEHSKLELQAESLSQPCDAASPIMQPKCPAMTQADKNSYSVTLENTMDFEAYRRQRLASMTMDLVLQTYTDQDTLVLSYGAGKQPDCQHLDHHFLDTHDDVCFAVAYVSNTEISYDVQRFDSDIDIYGLSLTNPDPSQIDKYSSKFPLNKHNQDRSFPTGFFRKVPKERGRERTKEKLGAFLIHYDAMKAQLDRKLSSHGIKKGDDLVVMVLNEGELDLFLNFACSCRLHAISLNNIIVFAGSPEVVPLVEATGAMALYHEGYASVSKKASTDYLDRVFVDMMWYKAFSVHFILSQGINILFQDLDLVWFREPMAYFHDYMKANGVEGFFSDDGQRSKRYTPFYANSGFYYLLATEKSVYFTWSIMIAMDAIQVLGSHQNVLTTRLIEGVAMNFANIKLLPLDDFPTGIMYHHNRPYMHLLREKKVTPYNFHMCWTQGKPDKLIYLRKAAMWYLTDVCSPLEALIAPDPEGPALEGAAGIYDYVNTLLDRSGVEQWDLLGQKCCMAMPGAP